MLLRLHTILCLILVLLTVVDRALPCTPDCAPERGKGCATVAVDAGCEGQENSTEPGDRCFACFCHCKPPAIPLQGSSSPRSITFESYPPFQIGTPPAADTSAPDHIPLA